MNSTENVWNITKKKEIGNQLLCLKEEMKKQLYELWYSVTPNVPEELYNSMPMRIADLIKEGEVQRIPTL